MNTRIEWTQVTWNPTTGCDRISPGCANCYALVMAGRLKAMGQVKYQRDGDPRTSGPGFAVTVHPGVVNLPLRWRARRLVFVNSMSDVFHARIPRPWVADIFAVMAAARQHTFQVLTKRPGRARALLTNPAFADEVRGRAAGKGLPAERWVWPLPNVWLGTSIELDSYTGRATKLRAAPAAVRFVSLEPLLGPLPSLDLTGIRWVIIGGESGPGARPLDLAWVHDIITRCRAAGAAVFVKQLGTAWATANGGRGAGGAWDRWPTGLRVREFPPSAELWRGERRAAAAAAGPSPRMV